MAEDTYVVVEKATGLAEGLYVGKPPASVFPKSKFAIFKADDKPGGNRGWILSEDGTWTNPHAVEEPEEPEADPAP